MAAKKETKDAEMKDASKDAPKAEKKETEKKAVIELTPVEAMRANLGLLERAVEMKDKGLITRVLRKNTALRRQLSTHSLREIVVQYIPDSCSSQSTMLQGCNALLSAESSAMEEDNSKEDPTVEASAQTSPAEPSSPRTSLIPEVECHLHTFIVSRLLQHKLSTEALANAQVMVSRCASQNRRTLDVFAARAYAHYARCYEAVGRSSEIRVELLAAHRTACLRLNEIGQATLINLVLRNFLQYNLVDQAAKFASKATFPGSVSNAQQVRYLYYLGRVHAIQLDYADAFSKLTQAIRKAPSTKGVALGFRIALHRLATIVQLLTGEVPDRAWFSLPELRGPLRPYFELVNSVRQGNVADYEACTKKHAAGFKLDANLSLVLRLRNSVIKTGLRRINTSYSRISFADVAKKLDLESAEATEFICAKGIRDGVIDAIIDHDNGWLCSNEKTDIYSTTEPQEAFHRRIQFCMSVHNDAQKAMRYPPDAHKRSGGGEDNEDNDEEETEEAIEEAIKEALDEEDGL